MSAKPWERKSEKTTVKERDATAKAKRTYSYALGADVNRRLTKDVAAAVAREYVKHGDMRHALIATGFVDEDTTAQQLSKIIAKVRQSRNFVAAFDHIMVHFDDTEILTRERVLAGLYIEASDRFGPTSPTARVTAWAKLAHLIGMEAEVKRASDSKDEAVPAGGVMMIPFSPSIEQWEKMAMTQQAKLKADVRL